MCSLYHVELMCCFPYLSPEHLRKKTPLRKPFHKQLTTLHLIFDVETLQEALLGDGGFRKFVGKALRLFISGIFVHHFLVFMQPTHSTLGINSGRHLYLLSSDEGKHSLEFSSSGRYFSAHSTQAEWSQAAIGQDD